MSTVEFITAIFCQVDVHLHDIPKHPTLPCGRVKSSRSGCCMHSKASAIVHFIGG
jgi:hypothetical protein